MASFTDRIPQFNPYVSQQPVDAMVKVGLQKQQQYDTNLQKIEQSMSNIAGLNVGRDVDKDYLQNKMDSMSQDLNRFASSDLSSNKLTTHIKSMVGGIADDEVVQNSVRSTAAAQNAKRLQSKYHEEGKGSPSNDWLLNSQLQEWYSNPNAGASFSGTYKPYQDYNAKALKVVKNVLEDEQISEKDYYIDENNKVVFSDIAVETKVAGKAQEKIQSALMAQLTPAELEQIQIDGRYQYANVSGEEFAQSFADSYDQRMIALNDKKQEILGAQKVASSPQEQKKLNNMLADINTKIGREGSEFKSINKMFSNGNYEGAKSQLYMRNWMANTSNAFSSSKTSETFKVSPRAEFAFKRQKEQRRMQEFNLEFRRKNQEHLDDMRIAKARLAQDKRANDLQMEDVSGYGPVINSKAQNELLSVTPEVLDSEIEISKRVIDKERLEIGKYYVSKDMYNQDTNPNKASTYEEYVSNFMDQKEQVYEDNPAAVKNKARDFFARKKEAMRVIETKSQVNNQVKKESQERFDTKLDGVITDNKSYDITLENGENLSFDTKELVKFNTKYDKVVETLRSTSIGKGATPMFLARGLDFIDEEIMNSTMSEKEKQLLKIRLKEENDFGGLIKIIDENAGLSQGEQAVSDLIFDAKGSYGGAASQLMEDKMEYEKNAISEKLFAMQGNTHNINLSTKQQANGSNLDQFKGVLQGIAKEAGKQNDGLADSPDFDKSTLETIIPNLETATLTIVEDVPTENNEVETIYEVTVSGKDNKTSFKIPKEQYQSIFKGRFDTTKELSKFNKYKKRIIATSSENTPIGTTAMDGTATNKDNAYLKNMDFPNVKFFGISGNLVSSDGKHYDLEINVKDPVENSWIEGMEFNTGVLDVDMQTQMDNISDAQILEMLLGQKPTAEQLKALEYYAKNPQ